MDNPNANRPERRTAVVARELCRYRVDIATFSETRFADEGHLTESGAGYTFFWCGRSAEDRRESGVGFAIKNPLIKKLSGPPKGIIWLSDDTTNSSRLKETCHHHQRLRLNNDKPWRC